jgi:hypothetical protein
MHYVNPTDALAHWTKSEPVFPWPIQDPGVFSAWDDSGARQAIAAANEIHATPLSNDEVNAILAFLHSLTDPGQLAASQP